MQIFNAANWFDTLTTGEFARPCVRFLWRFRLPFFTIRFTHRALPPFINSFYIESGSRITSSPSVPINVNA